MTSPGANKDYVAAMLDWADADVSRVYVRVTAAVGLALVYVTQLPHERLKALNHVETIALFVGLGCLGGAAILYFTYVNRTHTARRRIARCYVEANPPDPQEILDNEFKRWRLWSFGIGNGLFLTGAGLLALDLWPVLTG